MHSHDHRPDCHVQLCIHSELHKDSRENGITASRVRPHALECTLRGHQIAQKQKGSDVEYLRLKENRIAGAVYCRVYPPRGCSTSTTHARLIHAVA